ncbi:MAG: protein kinase domain-containing protein [Gemmatirosa sp.]
MATQPPATTIGKYQILGLVGEGAMGAVYRALDPVLQRPVAIKVMSDAVAREQELRERFLREAQAAGSLQHPNVVTIYDFGEVDGHLFIAMEFLDGEDLEALLARRVDLSLSAKLGIAVDVLGGLSYAHKRGIVHRDIKPANIRITEDERAKIMDFGVAHLTSQKMTRTGMTMGTPNYMAPEQVAGGTIGAHTDVFSLGAVLYELLTHHKPFAADTLHAVLYKIVSEPTPLASTHVPGLPPELDAIVARSLAKDPADRYQTAADMANDLTALRASLGTLSGVRQASSSISLNARLAAAVPGVAAHAPASPTPGVPTDAVPVAKAGVGRGALALTGVLAVVGLGVGAWAMTRGSGSATRSTDAAAPAPPVSSAPTAAPPPETPATAPSTRAPASTPTNAPTNATTSAATNAAPSTTPAAPAPTARARETTPAPTVSASVPASVPVSPRPAATAAPVAARTPTSPAARPPEGAATLAPSREPSTAAAPPAEPSANASAEIAETVARYARAISGRDLAAVRAAYPNITTAQEQNFERFFASVRELRATFTLRNLDVSGTTADARLNGVYEFVTSAGQRERSPVNFQAAFRRDGGSWVLSAVR